MAMLIDYGNKPVVKRTWTKPIIPIKTSPLDLFKAYVAMGSGITRKDKLLAATSMLSTTATETTVKRYIPWAARNPLSPQIIQKLTRENKIFTREVTVTPPKTVSYTDVTKRNIDNAPTNVYNYWNTPATPYQVTMPEITIPDLGLGDFFENIKKFALYGGIAVIGLIVVYMLVRSGR